MPRSIVALAILVTLFVVAAALASVNPPPAQSATLSQKLQTDMTVAHEHHPNGVPPNYQWWAGPFESLAPPGGYHAMEAWGQWYRCDGAGLDDNDVLEVHNVQTWQLGYDGVWRQSQTGNLSGAAYPENFQGPAVAANVVAWGPGSWGKVRMSAPGYNFHFYPSQRTGWDRTQVRAVVTAAEVRLWAYSPSTQCTVAGMGADYWQAVTSGTVNGATLGRLVHVDSSWRLITSTFGDEQAAYDNPPPLVTSQGAIR